MKYISIFLIFFICKANAQYNGRDFSVGVNVVYTTTAKLFLNPNSPLVIERNSSFNFDDIYSYGMNFRYNLLDNIFLDFNIEYMKETAQGKNQRALVDNEIRFIKVEDGFELVPLELSILYLLPFSTDKFKFLMGGGGGFYLGSQIRKFGDARLSTVERKTAYGIQVAIEMDYLIRENISLNTQMRFRDPQLTVTNRFPQKEYFYNGQTVTILDDEFQSKINVDGISFVLGISYHF